MAGLDITAQALGNVGSIFNQYLNREQRKQELQPE